MDFRIEQRYASEPGAVARSYVEPGLHEPIGRLRSSLGAPELLSVEVDGDAATLRVRYRFTGDLNAAARRALDPRQAHLGRALHPRPGAGPGRVPPDPRPLPRPLPASGPAAIEPGPGGDGAHRTVTGSLSIKAPLVGRLVENAVVSGLRDHLSGEATAVDRFLAG